MDRMVPQGAQALDDAELSSIQGGGFWTPFIAAFGIGFAAGQWLWCAAECLMGDN